MKTLVTVLLAISTLGTMAQAPAGAPRRAPRIAITLTTTAFEDGAVIPDKYTMAASGDAVSPHLTWSNVPEGVVSYALILHDPDSPIGKSIDQTLHWMIFNIPGAVHELPEGVPAQAQLPDGSIQALNQGKKVGYMGMGAAAAGPYHHYTFELFALDTKLALGPDATQKDVVAAMDGHILGKGVVVGRFHRP